MERGRRRRNGEIAENWEREGRQRAQVGGDHSFRVRWREEGKAMGNFKGLGGP